MVESEFDARREGGRRKFWLSGIVIYVATRQRLFPDFNEIRYTIFDLSFPSASNDTGIGVMTLKVRRCKKLIIVWCCLYFTIIFFLCHVSFIFIKMRKNMRNLNERGAGLFFIMLDFILIKDSKETLANIINANSRYSKIYNTQISDNYPSNLQI